MNHVLTVQYNASGEQITQQVSLEADAEDNRDIVVASDASDAPANIAIDYDQVKGLLLLSDVDCTVETNSASAPDDTITLTGGVPVIWYTGCGTTNPLTADVTAIYITNTSSPATAGTLKIRVLQDSTPA